MSASPSNTLTVRSVGELAHRVLRTLPGAAILVFDRELRIMLAGGDPLTYHGLDGEELEGRLAQSALPPDRWAIYEPLCRAALEGHREAVEIWSGDETRCYAVYVTPFTAIGDAVQGAVVVAHDITQRKHAEEARRHAQERFETTFEQSPIGMALLTADGRPVRVNRALMEMTGYTSAELLSRTLDDLTDPDEPPIDQDQLRRLRSREIETLVLSRHYIHARGHIIAAQVSISVVRDRQGRPLHLVAQIQDLTEIRQMERRLADLIERDQLTGLLSRKRLEQELIQRSSQARSENAVASLVVIGLDGFRRFNDENGHRAGDQLLVKIAAELRRRLRGGDTIARLGGDEFAVILPDTEADGATFVARDLAKMIANCEIEVRGSIGSCSASVGVTAITEGHENALSNALRAMHSSKGARVRLV